MKVGVIGLGYWGPNIVRTLDALSACSDLVVCDIDERRVEEVVRQFRSISGVSDYRKIVEDPDVDAVVVATPVRTHAELAELALMHGKSVLVEKPLAHSYGKAQELLELARRQELLQRELG